MVNFCSRNNRSLHAYSSYALVARAENQPRHLTTITASAVNPVTNPSDMWKNRSPARKTIRILNL